MESGTPLATWAYTYPETALQKAFLLGSRVGCTYPAFVNHTDELYECLRDTPGPLLMRVQQAGLSWEELFSLRPLAFVPTSEPPVPGAFLTKYPDEYFERGEYNKVPMLTGINTAEGLLFYAGLKKVDPFGMLVTAIGQDLTKLAPRELGLTGSSEHSPEVHRRMKAYYTGRTGPTNMITTLEILQIISDTQFLLPFLKTADYTSNKSDEKIYNYVFSFDGRYGCYKVTEHVDDAPGTAHMDELGYIFNLGPLEKIYDHSDRTKPEEQTIEMMTTIWTTFADKGIPSDEWRPFSRQNTSYNDLGTEITQKKNIQRETVQFWNEIYQLVKKQRPFPE